MTDLFSTGTAPGAPDKYEEWLGVFGWKMIKAPVALDENLVIKVRECAAQL